MAVLLTLLCGLVTGCGSPPPTETPTVEDRATPGATPVALATVDPMDLPSLPADLMFAPAGGLARWPAPGGRLVRIYEPAESVPSLGPLAVAPGDTSLGWIVAERRGPGVSDLVAMQVGGASAPEAVAPRVPAATVLDWTTGPGPGRVTWLERSPAGSVEVVSVDLTTSEGPEAGADAIGPETPLSGPGPYGVWAGPEGPFALWADGTGLWADWLSDLRPTAARVPPREAGQPGNRTRPLNLTDQFGPRDAGHPLDVLAFRDREGLAVVAGVEPPGRAEGTSFEGAPSDGLAIIDLGARSLVRLSAAVATGTMVTTDTLVAGPRRISAEPGQSGDSDGRPGEWPLVMARRGAQELMAVAPATIQALSHDPRSSVDRSTLETEGAPLPSSGDDVATLPKSVDRPTSPGRTPPTAEPFADPLVRRVPLPRDDLVIVAIHMAPSRDSYWVLTAPSAFDIGDADELGWRIWHLALPDTWALLARLAPSGPGGWQPIWSRDGHAVLLLDQATQGSAATYRSALVGALDPVAESPALAGPLYEAAGLVAGSAYFAWAPD